MLQVLYLSIKHKYPGGSDGVTERNRCSTCDTIRVVYSRGRPFFMIKWRFYIWTVRFLDEDLALRLFVIRGKGRDGPVHCLKDCLFNEAIQQKS